MAVILISALLPLVCAACSLITFKSAEEGGLVISEVVSSNKRALIDAAVGSPDWVELYNSSAEPIRLEGYGLSDNMRNLHKFTFPDVTIEPGAYLVVYCCDATEGVETDVSRTGFGLAKNGDFLFLTDAYYGMLQQLEVPALPSDVSYALQRSGSYGYCAAPTPGADNGNEIRNSLDTLFTGARYDALAISEVLPKDATGEPWVELLNTGDGAIRLEDYYLSDTESDLMRWQLPACTLEAGGRVIVYLTGQDLESETFHAGFTLGKSDDRLFVSDIKGKLLSKIVWDLELPAGISAVLTDAGETMYAAVPTMGAPNSAEVFVFGEPVPVDASDPIRINEILRRNELSLIDADGDRSEWVELHNDSASPASTAGLHLSDDPDNLLKWALPDVTLAPDAYLVVFLSGKDRKGSELHASFRLGDDEEALYLTKIVGLRVDAFPAPLDAAPNVSYGRSAAGAYQYFPYPTPGYSNGHGYETADSIGFFNKDGVFISEACAVQAAKSGANDWIELHNGATEPADLTGWYLTDDEDEPKKWQIGSLVLEPGQYVAIEASSHPTRQQAGMATFGLSPAGETLVLSDADGHTVDRFETGVTRLGMSVGRVETDPGCARVFFASPTKGLANQAGGACPGYTSQPVFSDSDLYRRGTFTVTIATVTPGASIHYTTDGSKPTARSKRCDGPITISRNTVLRAVAVAPGLLESEVTTATYLFETPHTVPVVSIVGDPADIQTVYRVTKRDEKVEREAYLQLYEATGQMGISFPAGIKVKGAGTLVYKQKSFTIRLRAAYGQSSVTYPFFPDFDLTTFSSLVLRNSGQDNDGARLRDSFFSRAVNGMHIDNAQTRPVVVYINGVYYGLYDFNEDLNSDYLVNHYGVDGDAVDVIRRNQTVLSGNRTEFLRVRKYALSRNLSKDDVFAQFAEWVDVAYFSDYLIAQTYFGNADMFNQKYWRSQDYAVKWRPIYYDLDFGLESATRSMIAAYFSTTGVPSNDGSLTYMDIYIGLRKNDGWKRMCAERYVELICTQFAPARLTAILDELSAEMRAEMPRHIERWGLPASMDAWEAEIAVLRRNIGQRPQYALEHVRSFFGLTRAELDALVAKYTPAA